MKYKITKRILIFICLFVGIGALYGSTCMFIDSTGKLLGMDGMLDYFKVLPFSDILFNDYIFSGISLLIVNGISNIISSILLIKNKKLGILLGGVFGFTLMLWCIIQFIIFPFNLLSMGFFMIGLLQLIMGYMTYVFYMQDKFVFNIGDYKNIGKNKSVLVVYYSRMGYTKKIAYEKANLLGGDILQINTTCNTSGTLGFWWCGRFGMLRRGMSINDIDIDLKKYKRIIIVSPIWVFSISGPIRYFCKRYCNDFNSTEYILTHFMRCNFESAALELDGIIGKKRDRVTSVCIRFGIVKSSSSF